MENGDVMTKRSYTDEQKADALVTLAAAGGNLKVAAARLGISPKTLSNWANGDCSPEVARLGQKKKSDLAAALESLACTILET
jgi:hypothetical protein